jgi:stage III sporulation protein AH
MIHKKEACEVKRVFKKNQIIIAALAVMIAVAGYLNYSGKIFHEKDGGAEEANADLANQELLDISEEDIETVGDEIASNDSDVEGTPGEAVLTNGSAETTVAQEQVRAQNKETLQAIIDNTNLSESEKQEAVSQLVQMTQIAEQEAAVETMMASKGFSEAVVSIDADSADIVVKAEELTDANRAQIEDIVTRKTKIAPQNIVITPIRE